LFSKISNLLQILLLQVYIPQKGEKKREVRMSSGGGKKKEKGGGE